jgi:hypothetical protein
MHQYHGLRIRDEIELEIEEERQRHVYLKLFKGKIDVSHSIDPVRKRYNRNIEKIVEIKAELDKLIRETKDLEAGLDGRGLANWSWVLSSTIDGDVTDGG